MSSPAAGHRSAASNPGSVSSTLLARVRARRPDAWQRLADLDGLKRERPDQGFRRWLAGITRHKVADHFRRARPVLAAGGTDAHERLQQVPDRSGGSEETDLASTDSRLPQRALELLRAEFEGRTWEAFWQTAVGGRRAADVAADLGMSVPAVYTAKSRVLHRLPLGREGRGGIDHGDGPEAVLHPPRRRAADRDVGRGRRSARVEDRKGRVA